jgi:hypothetical protein
MASPRALPESQAQFIRRLADGDGDDDDDDRPARR